jgi:argininosuccinate lyase
MRVCDTTDMTLEIFSKVIETIEFDLQKIDEAKTKELYATYYAFRLVKNGSPFRDAYKETAEVLEKGLIDIDDLKTDFLEISSSLKSELSASLLDLENLSTIITKKINDFKDLEFSLFS